MADRRDHPATPISQVEGQPCLVCGDPIRTVYDRHLSVKRRLYWRHVRRS